MTVGLVNAIDRIETSPPALPATPRRSNASFMPSRILSAMGRIAGDAKGASALARSAMEP